MTFFHTHAHSKFSVLDGMPTVADMVAKVVANGQPGLALTDHGNMSGAVQLYKQCRAAGIAPFIGEEFYLVTNVADPIERENRHHLGMMALDLVGYKALVRLSSRSHRRDRFHRKPLIDYLDLAEMADAGLTAHIAVTSGCYFGLIIQSIVTTGDTQDALDKLRMYARWFPHLYTEMQQHNGTGNELADSAIIDAQWDMASKLGIPVIVTQDAHYCDLAHQPLHDLMKQVGYYGAGSDEDEKAWTFPGDGFHLARTSWVKDHYVNHPRVWDASQSSYSELLELNKLTIPVLDTYRYHVPAVHETPLSYVVRRCNASLAVMDLDKSKKHVERFNHELDIVEQKGFADYFVLCSKLADFCRDSKIRVSARGSASGSIICWLMGITQLDPIKWKLTFERFLSMDRTSPPDIDFDVEMFRRAEVIDWLADQFTTIPIGNYGQMTQDEDSGRGSMLVKWLQRERNRLSPEKYRQKYGHVQGLPDLPVALQRKLLALGEMRVFKHYGTHACGIVVSDDEHPADELLPTMLVASGGHSVTQFIDEDVEAMGFTKVDVLGVRGESTIARCLELMGKSPIDDMSWMPLNDPAAFKVLRSGETGSGIFTFEGYTQAKGAREVKVRSVEDLILVNALYRPATMNSGYVTEYLNRKRDPSTVKHLHPVFEQAFGSTYGVPVYQEQVLALLRLIGMPGAELNSMLKAIKASNGKVTAAAEKMDEVEELFRKLCEDVGMTKSESAEAWTSIQQFSDYSFNRAHSAEYAIRGYSMAYLKVHYPLEFHSALLESVAMAGGGTQKDKEPVYIREARRYKLNILSADVTISNAYWTMDRAANGIRRGITSIHGIGDSVGNAIMAARPFATLDEMLVKAAAVNGRALPGGKEWLENANYTGAVAKLRDAGALVSLGHGKE